MSVGNIIVLGGGVHNWADSLDPPTKHVRIYKHVSWIGNDGNDYKSKDGIGNDGDYGLN